MDDDVNVDEIAKNIFVNELIYDYEYKVLD